MQSAKSERGVVKPEDRGDRQRGEGGEEEVEEEEEEEKMEQFFAILRNYRAARNQRAMELVGELEREAEESRRKRTRLAEPDGGERCSSWVPRFEPEDFSANVAFRTRPLPLPIPHPRPPPPRSLPPPPAKANSLAKAVERERKVKDDGLELKLTI